MEVGWFMSICPLCNARREDRLTALMLAVVRATNEDEWVTATVHLEAFKYDGWPKKTLREDYELGMGEEGVLKVDYACGCSECGFMFHDEYKVGARLVSSWTEAQAQAMQKRKEQP